jgi:hypothetical protein
MKSILSVLVLFTIFVSTLEAKNRVIDSLFELDKEAYMFEFHTKRCAKVVSKAQEDVKNHPHCLAFIQKLSKEKMLNFNKRFENELKALKKLESSGNMGDHERYWVYQYTQKNCYALKRDA